MKNSETLELGIGDDCAILKDEHRKLITVDMLSDGVHFDTEKEDPYLIVRKLLAVSLSDIAAMGGSAKQAFIAINIDKSKKEVSQRAMQGIIDLAKEFDVAIAGGGLPLRSGTEATATGPGRELPDYCANSFERG